MSSVHGNPEQLTSWQAQANRLYDIESFVIIGSIARVATYATFGWEGQPLSLEYHNPYWPFSLRLRDFDGVLPFGKGDVEQLNESGEYPVDLTIHRQFFNHRGGYRFGIQGQGMPVRPEVFTTRTRLLAGVPIRTFAIGTLQHLNNLYGGNGLTKYLKASEKFDQFADAMRDEHPDEFLPDEAYEPLRMFRRNALDLSI